MNRAIAASVVLVLAGCQTMTSPDAAKAEVHAATQAWAAAFNACDASKAAGLYHPDAVLWGTYAPEIISTPAGIRQYFERVCSSGPPPKVNLREQLVRVYDDTAVDSGTYTFAVVVQGQPRSIPARYSLTYRKTSGQWLIIDHHSSALPAPPQPASAPPR
jgi:uncharacterized protein (TIGR02246 family)